MRDLGSESFTWGDLAAIVEGAPQGSPLHRAFAGEAWPHDWGLELQRRTLHMVQVLAWQQTPDGQTGRGHPVPFRFPWDPVDTSGDPDALTVDEAIELLGLPEKYRQLASAVRPD